MENEVTEWKRIWKDSNLKTVCAFGNTKGGVMIIGIDDDGTVIGVSDPKGTQKAVSDTICNKLRIYPSVAVEENDGKQIIVITVEPSPYPIDIDGRYYVRVGNTNHEIIGRELERFVLRRAGTSWTDLPEPRVNLEDLDKNALLRLREMALKVNV